MMKIKADVNREDVRRALNLPADYTITAVVVPEDGSEITFELESNKPVGAPPKRHNDLTQIIRLLNYAIDLRKEVKLEYDNESRNEITHRTFLPLQWNEDKSTISGVDLDINEVRRFSLGKIRWIEL